MKARHGEKVGEMWEVLVVLATGVYPCNQEASFGDLIYIPSRELTYPTLEKGKSSSKCRFLGGYVSFLEGMG